MKSLFPSFASSSKEEQDSEPMSFWSCGGLTDLMPSCSFWDETAKDSDYDYDFNTELRHRQASMQYAQDEDGVSKRSALSAITEESRTREPSSKSLASEKEAESSESAQTGVTSGTTKVSSSTYNSDDSKTKSQRGMSVSQLNTLAQSPAAIY